MIIIRMLTRRLSPATGIDAGPLNLDHEPVYTRLSA
jgi:hypothetical protein